MTPSPSSSSSMFCATSGVGLCLPSGRDPAGRALPFKTSGRTSPCKEIFTFCFAVRSYSMILVWPSFRYVKPGLMNNQDFRLRTMLRRVNLPLAVLILTALQNGAAQEFGDHLLACLIHETILVIIALTRRRAMQMNLLKKLDSLYEIFVGLILFFYVGRILRCFILWGQFISALLLNFIKAFGGIE